MLVFFHTTTESRMSIATGILYLVLAASFAAQARATYNDRPPATVVLLGILMGGIFGALATLQVLQSRADGMTGFGWMSIVLLLIVEAVIGVIAGVLFREDQADTEYPPELFVYTIFGASVAGFVGLTIVV